MPGQPTAAAPTDIGSRANDRLAKGGLLQNACITKIAHFYLKHMQLKWWCSAERTTTQNIKTIKLCRTQLKNCAEHGYNRLGMCIKGGNRAVRKGCLRGSHIKMQPCWGAVVKSKLCPKACQDTSHSTKTTHTYDKHCTAAGEECQLTRKKPALSH